MLCDCVHNKQLLELGKPSVKPKLRIRQTLLAQIYNMHVSVRLANMCLFCLFFMSEIFEIYQVLRVTIKYKRKWDCLLGFMNES